MLYVEIGRGRDCAEVVTDDKAALMEQLEAFTGERIEALEGIGGMAREVQDREVDSGRGSATGPDTGSGCEAGRSQDGSSVPLKQPEALRQGRPRGSRNVRAVFG